MEQILKYSLFISMGATFCVMIIGLYSLLKGNIKNARYSNKMMQLRIIYQTIALITFTILISYRQ